MIVNMFKMKKAFINGYYHHFKFFGIMEEDNCCARNFTEKRNTCNEDEDFVGFLQDNKIKHCDQNDREQ